MDFINDKSEEIRLKKKFELKRQIIERTNMIKNQNKQWKKIIKTFEQHPQEIMNVVPTPKIL